VAGIMRQLGRFWIKINRDWMFNLAGMLSYNLLLAVLPLLVLSISLLGVIFQHSASACSANQIEGQLISNLASFLPGQITGARPRFSGATSLTILCSKLSHESLTLAVFGVITGLWFGSRLFVKLENCLGIIFRLRSRSFLHQNGIALGMTVLFAVLGPLSVLITIAPGRLLAPIGVHRTASSPVSSLIGWIGGAIVAFLLIELIYIVVPNQHMRPGEVWRGALVAALLLSIYELIFPLYTHLFFGSNSYGAVAGLLVILLLFFYYFAVILLLGAEINSWHHGQSEPSGDIATVLAQATWQEQKRPLVN
jgi:membrane protein